METSNFLAFPDNQVAQIIMARAMIVRKKEVYFIKLINSEINFLEKKSEISTYLISTHLNIILMFSEFEFLSEGYSFFFPIYSGTNMPS